jgi:hypothetical protein
MQMPKAASKNISTRQAAQTSTLAGAYRRFADQQPEHGQRQHKADAPGKALLWRAAPFGLLVAHGPLAQDQAGRIAWVDEDADREVQQEGHHEHPRGRKLPTSQAFMKEPSASCKQDARAARTARSFSTGTG